MDAIIADVIGSVALVLVLSSILGTVAQRIGQPRVIGQILTGILLGPTLLGQLPGDLTSHLFPGTALPTMKTLANIALVIFMFVVGYELDLPALRGTRRAVPMVAGSALLVPMALAMGAVVVFKPGFESLGGPDHLSRSFMLFMGVTLSITAMPVLAAIIRERGIAGTPAGVTATAAASIMDVLAWLVLAAALVGTVHEPGRPLIVTTGLTVAFVAAMLTIVRPTLRWWIKQKRSLLVSHVPIAFALALSSAWVTTELGLHAAFGGFLAGLAMPSLDGTPDAEVLRPMEQVGNLLLPLFFVVTGLSLNIGSLPGTAFGMLVVICVIAIAGKVVPAYAASRAGGLTRKDSVTVAMLMNTRGLTELIALDVGLTSGIIEPDLFTVLVLMALITTLVTAPVLSLLRLPAPTLSKREQVLPPASNHP